MENQIFETSILPESGYWTYNQQYGLRGGEGKYKWVNPFYSPTSENDFWGLERFSGIFSPGKVLNYCGVYCKSLGYHRKNDPLAMQKCKAECRVNIVKIRQKKYKIAPAEANIPEPDVTAVEKEADTIPQNREQPEGEGSNLGLIIGGIVGFLVLIVIIIMLFKYLRKTGK